MSSRLIHVCCIPLTFIALLASALPTNVQGDQAWRDKFTVKRANLVDRGSNTYFILEPGYRLRLENGNEALTVTVLDETRVVDRVKTRVVEERETKDGQLVEVSRNFFAIDRTTMDLYYFGEAVDIYKNGQVSSHEGQWLSGENGAKFGLMIPGKPRVGDKYYQENAPGVARDRAEVISTTEEFKVPAGSFKNCLRTRESSEIESGVEDKGYAPNVGLIKHADFTLVKVERGAK